MGLAKLEIEKHMIEHQILKTANEDYVNAFLPVGTVLMYKGTGIANVSTRSVQIGDDGSDTITLHGWYVCNGNVSTPNLFNKFIRAETASGNTGGSDDAINVSHTHTFSGSALGTHGHTFTGSALGTHGHTFSGSALGTHNHNASSGNQSASHTHSHTHGAIASGNQSASHTHDTVMGSHGHEIKGSPNAQAPNSALVAQYTGINVGYTENTDLGTKTSGNQNASHTHSTTIPVKNSGTQSASHTHTITNVAISAGTPAGTNSTTSGGTPAGTNSSESAGTPAGTNSTEGASGTGANIPAYYSLIFIIKMS